MRIAGETGQHGRFVAQCHIQAVDQHDVTAFAGIVAALVDAVADQLGRAHAETQQDGRTQGVVTVLQWQLEVGQSQRGTKTGGIETMEAPIHISNVALVDPSTKKPTKVGHRVEEQTKDGVKRTVRVRYAKKSGKDL